MPRVSVVIPAFNAAALLGETIRSVLDSRFRDLEVVVVNDGSRDETASVASGFGSPVRVINQDNAGMSASRNRGIAESDSEFITLLDSDDIWHPEKLSYQLAAFESHPEHAYCFTEFRNWPGGATAAFLAEPRTGFVEPSLSGWLYHKLLLTNWALPSSIMFRRSAWDTTGPFLCDDQKTDDWEYFVRASRSFQFLKLAEPFVLYRQHPDSLSRRIQSVNSTELMRERLIERYGTSSPDGSQVDLAELARRQYIGWRNFADAHCARGNVVTGLTTFGKLLFDGPCRAESLQKLAMSLARRTFPRR